MKKNFFTLCAALTVGTLMTAMLCFTGPALAWDPLFISDGFITGAALLNQGADLAAGAGIANAANAANEYGAFTALSGGKLRYDTGARSDLSGVSLMAGLSRRLDVRPGRLTFGAFFEYGDGSYDTRGSAEVTDQRPRAPRPGYIYVPANGDGDADYFGGGLLVRMDFNGAGAERPYAGHFYSEGSVRAGRVRNEYNNGILDDDTITGDYKASLSSSYFGLHLGAGYVWNLNERSSFDLYGKYFWTRQGGDSVTLSTEFPQTDVTLDSANSHRLRLGGRFTYNQNERVSTYIGAAWEHELDGGARAAAYDVEFGSYSFGASSIEGDTGIGEIGLTITPSPDKPLTMELGVQGYAGAREGVTGSLRVKWEF